MERKVNIFKKVFIIISFCMFLYIALGFTLQQGKLSNMHLCPYSSDTGATCMMSNFEHLQHWLTFVSSNIPQNLGVFTALLLLFIAFKFKKNLFNFFSFNKIKVQLKIPKIGYPPNTYLKDIFLNGIIGSRAP